jgi:hypothetical protein
MADTLSRRLDDKTSDQEPDNGARLKKFIEAQIFTQEVQNLGSELLNPSEE